MMAGIEPGSSGVGKNGSSNWAHNTAHGLAIIIRHYLLLAASIERKKKKEEIISRTNSVSSSH